MATLQVRNLPEATHQTLRTRATRAGQSLSDYVAGLLNMSTRVPTLEEWFDRVNALEPLDTDTRAADVLREERDRR
ncbi:MAG: hypothetical protein FWD75_06560 [Propionibacteriaceae bacterium]|nr:hypothetical protein [Propionibacteriaceae bacterium]